jgi:flagellar basal-body rod protein FlgB
VLNSFNTTVDLLHRAMDVAVLREQTIANNIANADVPNFKRSEINFESELKRALDSEKYKPALEMTRTDPRHLSNDTVEDWRKVEPRRTLDWATTAKNNGNNVDAEQETQLKVRNELMYQLLTTAENFQFNQVKTVLRT